jgi:prolyl-tRNA editing enzyme YbaK/EbsC (Cys-tRNA(Pro) deacylase)
MTDLTAAEQRVADALAAHGLPGQVIVLEELATTAQMAAEALGVEVGRIVKSLVFRGADSGRAYLLLVSGANRVHE